MSITHGDMNRRVHTKVPRKPPAPVIRITLLDMLQESQDRDEYDD